MRLVKVAMPPDAEIVVVPPSVPPDAVTTIEADDVVTRFPPLSSTLTTGWVPSAAPAPAPTGCAVTDNCVAAPTVGVTDWVADV